ncbi:putative metalloprotease CJM1_0395 family protein [Marinobacterium sp. YM272]|uniref:putative metalloprotease CJM1_0395 family protein n=1 Tax=Marinobacterium sp. YM272 TaxID=3421654 RepID=UPI003D7F8717
MITAISSYNSFSRWSGSENTQTRGSDDPESKESSPSGNNLSSTTSSSAESRDSDLSTGQRVSGTASATQADLNLQDQQIVQALSARDREVRTHEQAHQNAGGALTGAASYTYEKGPDGRLYAVGGEVSVQMPSRSGDPQRDIERARQVASAALAPAEPSAQDRRVAQAARQVINEAQAELASIDQQEVKNPLAGEEAPEQAQTMSDQAAAPVQSPAPVQTPVAESAVSRISAAESELPGNASERHDALAGRLGEYFDTLQQQDAARSQRLAEYQASREELSQRLREFNQKLVDMGVLNPDYYIGAVINDQA